MPLLQSQRRSGQGLEEFEKLPSGKVEEITHQLKLIQQVESVGRQAATKCKVYFTDLGAKINLKRGLIRSMSRSSGDCGVVGLQQELLEEDDIHDTELQQDSGLKEHIIFMVNGLFGNSSNWLVVEEKLMEQLNTATTLFHKSQVNQFAQTFDGVEVCGDRLCDEMVSIVSRYPNLERISIISHSMGGLFVRYAIGKLYNKEKSTICGLYPCHFITLVTPHLGSDAEGPAQVPFLSWPGMVPGVGNHLHNVFSYFASPVTQRMYKRSGLQLFLDDDHQDPMLLKITRDIPEQNFYFWSALSSFKTRTCFANAGEDHIVGWPNASIRDIHELPQIDFENKVCKGVVREDPIEIAFVEKEREKVKQLVVELNLQQYSQRAMEDTRCSPVGTVSPHSFYSAESFIDLMEGKWEKNQGLQQNGEVQEGVMRVGSPLGSYGLEEMDFQIDLDNFEQSLSQNSTEPNSTKQLQQQQQQSSSSSSQQQQFQQEIESQQQNKETQQANSDDTLKGEKQKNGQQYFQTSAERMEKSKKILEQLQKLNWRRVDVSFRDAKMKMLSHQLIQVTRRWINWEGEGVPEYLAVQFKMMEELIQAIK